MYLARAAVLVLAAAAACTSETPLPPTPPAPLAPLPPPAPASTDRFRDAQACAQCHLVDDTKTALHDATGANVSPVLLWRSSLMANAARDPYYLAELAAERTHGSPATVDPLCVRCHAPAGAEESGNTLGFDDLVGGSSPAAVLGRNGVTCSLCHQIAADGLGTDASFTGRFTVGYGRMIFGRYGDPDTSPMMLILQYTPTLGTQIEDSALCGSCHTVVVPAAGGSIVEQATFLEWRASSYPGKQQPCQACHVPTTDAANQPISTAVAGYPAGLSPRMPVGRHVFVGGNSYVLSLLADGADWAGVGIDPTELTASAARDDAHLQTAARLTIADAHREGDTLVVTAHVENDTGHKLPTGYPSRRMWLHVTVKSGEQVVWESGRADAHGEIVDGSGAALPPQPHRDQVTSPDQAQIWESVLVDASGAPTDRTLAADHYGKDDRILPAGFAPTGLDLTRTAPVGTDGDASFVPGSDDVTYRIGGAPANATVELELLYEAIRPGVIDAVHAGATPAGERFVGLAHARPVAPVTLAQATTTVP